MVIFLIVKVMNKITYQKNVSILMVSQKILNMLDLVFG